MKIFTKFTPAENLSGLIYFLLQLFVVPALLMVVNTMLPHPYTDAAVNFMFYAVNFLVVTVLFRRFLIDNFRIVLAHPWHVLRYAGIGLLIYFAGNTLFSFLITALMPDFANINDAVILQMVGENYTLMCIGTVFLVPLVEECFYRGLIFRNIFDKSPLLAYLASMVIFSMVHVVGYVTIADWQTLVLCFIQYLPAGFALAFIYRKSGSIFASILMHMAVNQIGMLMMR